MKIVRIQALAREGFTSRPRAGRFWPSAEPIAVEVIDGDEDPTVEVDKQDSAGKRYVQQVPHPTRISRKVFEEQIMADPILRVLGDGETISVLSQAALDAARKQASDLAGKLVDAESKLADATEQLAKAKARNAELEALIAAKAAGAVGGEAGKADTAETVTHDKGSGKGKGK